MRLLVAVWLLIAPAVSVSGSLVTPSTHTPDLEAIARIRPCLATALVYLGGGKDVASAESGIVRLEGIPTWRSVTLLLGDSGDLSSEGFVMQAGPGSDQDFYVEISYTIREVKGSKFYFVSARAEIVDENEVSLPFRHVIEPLSTAVVDEYSVRLVPNPKML